MLPLRGSRSSHQVSLMPWPRYRTHPSKVTSPLHLGDTFKIKLNFQGTLKVDKFWHSYIAHSILSRRILRAFAQRTSLTSDTKTADATWALLSTLYKYYITFFHKSQIFDSGASNRSRTCNLIITNDLRYLLRHTCIWGVLFGRPHTPFWMTHRRIPPTIG